MDDQLRNLVLRRVKTSQETCDRALRAGVICIADLNVKDETHVRSVGGFINELVDADRPVPTTLDPRWLEEVGSRQIMKLAATHPFARSKVTGYIQSGTVSLGELVWHGTFPAPWVKAIEKKLIDTGNWDDFHAVQDRLPPQVVAKLRPLLASKAALHDQQKKEAAKEARAKRVPKVDPLTESIAKRDVERLKKLKLEELAHWRWQANKDAWMASKPEIVAQAIRLPADYIEGLEVDILKAVAQQEWAPAVPWPIKKEVFLQLDAETQASFVRECAIATCNDHTPMEVKPPLTQAELDALMTGAVLVDPSYQRLSAWLDARQTVKSFTMKGNLSDEERQNFTMLFDEDTAYFEPSSWLSGEDEPDLEIMLDTIKWIAKQPASKRGGYAKIMRECFSAVFGATFQH